MPAIQATPDGSPRPPLRPSTPAADPALPARQSAFAQALGKRIEGRDNGQTPEEQARSAAEQLVTQTLILPVLKQLRESDHSAPPFAPTQAEKQFRALGDAALAQQIAHAARFPLVDRLAHDLLKRAGVDSAGRRVDGALNEARTVAPVAGPTGAFQSAPRR